MNDVNLLLRLSLISIVNFKASLEKGISSLSNLGKETVRGLMVHAMVEVIIITAKTLLQFRCDFEYLNRASFVG